jgi:Ankyrin repeats (many copies)
MSRSREPYWVVKYGSDEGVAKWLARGGHIDDYIDPVKKETAMHVAVGGPGSDRVKLLLNFKPDLSIRDGAGRTPMDVATEDLKSSDKTPLA